MADRFFSVALGEHLPHQVTEGGSTSGEAIELRVNDSVYSSKMAGILGVRTLLSYLESNRETSPIA